MSVTLKINMPLTAWNEINKKVNYIKKYREDFNVNIEEYAGCERFGKLIFDLNAIEIGAKEKLEAPEYYRRIK